MKLFVEEAGRDRVLAMVEQADEIAIASICLPETFAMLNRVKHERLINPDQYEQVKASVLKFSDDINILELDQGVISRSIELTEKHIIKGMDAIHIATAINWKADCFLSADRNQAKVSGSCRLQTELIF